jgi:hypothetical protein
LTIKQRWQKIIGGFSHAAAAELVATKRKIS